MGSTVLVIGGTRSGKSRFAERLAAGLGSRVVYLATAEVYDAEMEARVALHRERRPDSWATIEAPRDLAAALARLDQAVDVTLVECLAVWASNRLLDLGDPEDDGWRMKVEALDDALGAEIDGILMRARDVGGSLVLVSAEVGYGVVPPTPLGRAFRDLLGGLNQRVAARADAVFLVVAGLGLEVKGQAIAPEDWTARSSATDG